MLDFITGRMVCKHPTYLIVESGGIGYLINIPLSTYDDIPDHGVVKVFTQLFIRNEQIMLFGFATTDERDLFRLLISVNGIGPKIALSILSGSSVVDFKHAVISEDVNIIKTIKGIGKKLAERIILELKEPIKNIMFTNTFDKKDEQDSMVSDAIMALVSLGYVRTEAQRAVDKALKMYDLKNGVEGLIRQALKSV